MLKKTITYNTYDGDQLTQDFYFNLNMAEISKMELGVRGGLSNVMRRIANTHDVPSMVEYIDKFIELSYGVKSDDGTRFIKSEELTQEFKQSEAYAALFMELLGDPKAQQEFVNGIIPAEALKQINEHPEIVQQVKADMHLTENGA